MAFFSDLVEFVSNAGYKIKSIVPDGILSDNDEPKPCPAPVSTSSAKLKQVLALKEKRRHTPSTLLPSPSPHSPFPSLPFSSSSNINDSSKRAVEDIVSSSSSPSPSPALSSSVNVNDISKRTVENTAKTFSEPIVVNKSLQNPTENSSNKITRDKSKLLDAKAETLKALKAKDDSQRRDILRDEINSRIIAAISQATDKESLSQSALQYHDTSIKRLDRKQMGTARENIALDRFKYDNASYDSSSRNRDVYDDITSFGDTTSYASFKSDLTSEQCDPSFTEEERQLRRAARRTAEKERRKSELLNRKEEIVRNLHHEKKRVLIPLPSISGNVKDWRDGDGGVSMRAKQKEVDKEKGRQKVREKVLSRSSSKSSNDINDDTHSVGSYGGNISKLSKKGRPEPEYISEEE